MPEISISNQVIEGFIEKLSELNAIDESLLEPLKYLLNADRLQKADIKKLFKEGDEE